MDNSPAIKYHLDLLSAGLEESADGDPLPLRDRRQKLEAYCSRWESFDRAEYTLLDPPPLPNSQSAYVDKGFLVYYEDVDDGKENIYFVRLPSRTMETSQEEWMIRGLPASGHQQAIHPPSNLLAIPILSEEEKCVLLNDSVVAYSLSGVARSKSRCSGCPMANHGRTTFLHLPWERDMGWPNCEFSEYTSS